MEENGNSIQYFGYQYPSNFQIPFDFYVSKKYERIGGRGCIRFTDSSGNLMYRVEKLSNKLPSAADDDNNSDCTKLLVDASSGNTLFSVMRVAKGSWRGYKGCNQEEADLMFVVDRTLDEFTRTEFRITLLDENNKESKTELKMNGCPFKRACTIYNGDLIVAESSLMYKLGLGKVFVPRNRFRVTIFPGFTDRSLVASLILLYFDGRKLWV